MSSSDYNCVTTVHIKHKPPPPAVIVWGKQVWLNFKIRVRSALNTPAEIGDNSWEL